MKGEMRSAKVKRIDDDDESAERRSSREVDDDSPTEKQISISRDLRLKPVQLAMEETILGKL